MDIRSNQLQQFVLRIKPWLIPKPYSGSTFADFLYLVLICSLQFGVLPPLVPIWFRIDILTPWMISTFILTSFPRSALYAVVTGLLIETHSSAPAGMYISIYWVAMCVIQLTKSHLSWRIISPWLICYLAAQIWVIAFESFVGFTKQVPISSWQWLMISFTHVFSGSMIGLLLMKVVIRRRCMEKGIYE